MNLFDWLVCYLLKISYEKVEAEGKLGKNSFTSKNNSQVFYLKTLSICFMEVSKLFEQHDKNNYSICFNF